ncbi:DUF433 domain-containing protein [Nocardioides sp. CFH 31398]|uniref:DUF433 domain-containing protein n=1 Tax=Nocardioides sp. CFH 31398 TaxID=2919579 RepID=UPI001F064BD4|nr:DUF433 domain-containing protein [Nocardioides sp. CFH 31398]MCH1867008.1 DUF433 domain-containing protein [Nocardioides sp. CFH 31398]
MDDNLVVFSRARAARLAGLTARQLDYWRTTLLLEPATNERISSARAVRLYSFTDMVALVTISRLLDRKVPLQRIRKVVDRLRAAGRENPLVELKFGVYGATDATRAAHVHLTVRFADGHIEVDDAPGQPVLGEEVLVDLEEIRASLRDARRRDAATVGETEKRRNALGSKPLIAGTRIPVATILRYFRAQVPDSEILEAFPALAAEDLDALRVAN